MTWSLEKRSPRQQNAGPEDGAAYEKDDARQPTLLSAPCPYEHSDKEQQTDRIQRID
jgi:hypothetical protein